MGAENSKGKRHEEAAVYGEIYVQTDKTTYSASDLVTGKIYLNLTKAYPGTQLFLKLKGKEVVHMMIEREDPETTNITKEYANQDYEIINMAVPVETINGFTTGQYEVPFAFMLPKSLPSSFHQEGENFLANISYRLEAYLQPSNKSKEPKLKQKQPFVIRQPIRSVVASPENEVTTPLRDCLCFLCCCCVSKGSNVLKLKLEKSNYIAGETAKVRVFMDNTKSKLNTEEVVMALKQKVTLRAGSKADSTTYLKSQMMLGKVRAGKEGNKEFFDLPLLNFEGKDYQDIKNLPMREFLAKSNDTNSTQNLNPTTYGSLITSEYYLEVICSMEGWWADSPLAMLPLEVCHPEKNPEVVTPPTKWAPTNTLVANLSFGTPMFAKDKKKLTVNNTSINFDMLQSPGMSGGSNLPTGLPSSAIQSSQQQVSNINEISNNNNQSSHQQVVRAQENNNNYHDDHDNGDILGTMITDHVPQPLNSYRLPSKQAFDTSRNRI